MEKRVIPLFTSEREEADWWFEHREEITQDIIEASRTGRTGVGVLARLKQLRERRAQGDLKAESHTNSSEQVLASAE